MSTEPEEGLSHPAPSPKWSPYVSHHPPPAASQEPHLLLELTREEVACHCCSPLLLVNRRTVRLKKRMSRVYENPYARGDAPQRASFSSVTCWLEFLMLIAQTCIHPSPVQWNWPLCNRSGRIQPTEFLKGTNLLSKLRCHSQPYLLIHPSYYLSPWVRVNLYLLV